MKKLMSLLTSVLLCAGVFAGCASTPPVQENAPSVPTVSPLSDELKQEETSVVKEGAKIGVVQIVEHPSLDTIRDSFTAQLEALGYKNGENCTIEYKSAQGDQNILNSIIQSFSGAQMDLIVAIATPTAQAAAPVAQEIPVIFSAVSDPIGAGLVTTLESPDKNITGTCDAIQVADILRLAQTIDPEMKTLGVIYNAGEANSISNIEKAKAYAQENGLTIVETTVANSSEVQQAAQVLCNKADAIFAPNDNTVASAMPALAETAKQGKIPVYVGADSMVQDGGFATIGIDYTDLGRETANMASRVLNGEDIASIPVKVFDTDLSTYLNTETIEEIGISIADEVINGEKVVLLP